MIMQSPFTSRSLRQPWLSSAMTTNAGEAAGYKVTPTQHTGRARATQTWRLSAHAPLLAVETAAAGASTRSRVKVQGDRTMRLRHLNPNLALLVSGASNGAYRARLGAATQRTAILGRCHLLLAMLQKRHWHGVPTVVAMLSRTRPTQEGGPVAVYMCNACALCVAPRPYHHDGPCCVQTSAATVASRPSL